MITVGMNYQVLPGKEPAFEKMFKSVLGVMQEIDGHTRSALYRDVDEPQRYLIISDWQDREAFDAFIASDRFRQVTNWGKQQILAGRPSHDYYEK